MTLANLLRVNENFPKLSLVHDDVKGGGPIPWCSHHCATILQRWRRQNCVRVKWHQQDDSVKEGRSNHTHKEPRTYENVPVFGTPVPTEGQGFIDIRFIDIRFTDIRIVIQHQTQETERCASRRWPR